MVNRINNAKNPTQDPAPQTTVPPHAPNQKQPQPRLTRVILSLANKFENRARPSSVTEWDERSTNETFGVLAVAGK
jgi:hypothetical protein